MHLRIIALEQIILPAKGALHQHVGNEAPYAGALSKVMAHLAVLAGLFRT